MEALDNMPEWRTFEGLIAPGVESLMRKFGAEAPTSTPEPPMSPASQGRTGTASTEDAEKVFKWLVVMAVCDVPLTPGPKTGVERRERPWILPLRG